MKPHTQCFFYWRLLMVTPKCGGPMAIPRQKGRKIQSFSTGTKQLITEPTNLKPNKNPTCRYLILTDQSKLVLDCGTRQLIDSYCHHEITYCQTNLQIPPPPLLPSRGWHHGRANITLM